METWTEILAPGVYRLPTGKKLTVLRSDVENAAKFGNEMIREGLRIPGCWQHDMSAFPEYQNNPNWYTAKGYYGEPKEFSVKNGKLFALMQFKDEQDFKQFKKVGTTSPRIVFNRVDERGKTWPGMTIAHIASTPTPVQRDQSRLAYDFSASGNVEAERKPGQHYDLSTSEGVNMEEILKILESMGLRLGEGASTPEDVKGRLSAIAANGGKFSMGSGGSAVNDNDADNYDGSDVESEITGGAGNTEAANAAAPMVMSQLPKGMQLRAKSLLKQEKDAMLRETNQIFKSGRLTAEEAKKHREAIISADLSLTDKFELALTPIVVRHKAFKGLKPGSGWKPTGDNVDMSAFDVQNAPGELNAEKPAEVSPDDIVNERLKRSGHGHLIAKK